MKIVLAYSGGLDTSVALHWLKKRYDAEIIAFCADIGQIESLDTIEERALRTGASKVYVEPLTDRFLKDFALPAMRAHARYENKYLVAAPLSRPLIAQRMVEVAHAERTDAVAHGATGKGNDQVRFFTGVTALDPSLRVLAPVIDWELTTRESEFAYAREHGIQVPVTPDSPYSIDTNIWGTSIECGELDDIGRPPPAGAWQLTAEPGTAPDRAERVTIGFETGIPVALDGERLQLAELVHRLNTLAARHGVGRVDIVENRIVGFKTRGIYEAPAATVLMTAHEELEAIVLDRETLHHKQSMALRYAELVYYRLLVLRPAPRPGRLRLQPPDRRDRRHHPGAVQGLAHRRRPALPALPALPLQRFPGHLRNRRHLQPPGRRRIRLRMVPPPDPSITGRTPNGVESRTSPAPHGAGLPPRSSAACRRRPHRGGADQRT
ncbi:argininosuccinate synthase [Streptomyces sp. NPDC055080]